MSRVEVDCNQIAATLRLSQFIRRSAKLTYLSLANCCSEALMESVWKSLDGCTIRHLEFKHVNLSGGLVLNLAQAVRQCTSLRSLHLEASTLCGIFRDGATTTGIFQPNATKHLLNVMNDSSIEELYISDEDLTDSGTQWCLVRAVARVVSCCTHLRRLSLIRCNLMHRGEDIILSAAKDRANHHPLTIAIL